MGQAGPAIYGPFHRVRTRKQTKELAEAQEREGRVCGYPPNWGGAPSVKAYRGPLLPDEQGIEFWTDTPPTGTGTVSVAYWREGEPGVTSHPNDMVCISVIVTRRVP
jgi:hypothetical protein